MAEGQRWRFLRKKFSNSRQMMIVMLGYEVGQIKGAHRLLQARMQGRDLDLFVRQFI